MTKEGGKFGGSDTERVGASVLPILIQMSIPGKDKSDRHNYEGCTLLTQLTTSPWSINIK